MKKLSKKLLAVILVVFIFTTTVPVQGLANTNLSDLFTINVYAETDYSDYTPIFNADDLKMIGENLSGKYILARDIDLSTVNWTPLGTETTPFTGIFNGNGKKISNLSINGTYDNGAQIGLFGYANGAEFTNVKLKNVQINILGTAASGAYLSIGSICGVINNTIIDKCDADGNIICSAEKGNYVRVAGMVGESYSSSSITNCLSSCSLVGNAKSRNCMVGGITAWLGASSIAKCLFSGSINAGTSSTYVYCGGIGASGDCGISESVVLASELNNNGISSAYGTSLNGYICWRNTSNNKVLTNISGNVSGLRGSGNLMITEEQAVNKKTYTDMDWDFDNIWTMNDGYPELQHNMECDAWESENLSDDAKSYIQEHINFVNSNAYNNLMTNAGFYNTLWQYESTDRNFTAYTAWEVLGDIGEVATLNFNDLFVTENPYDVILADVLSGYVIDNTILNMCEKTLESVFNVDKITNDIIKILQTSDEWNDATDIDKIKDAVKSFFGKSKEKFIDGVFFSTEEYNFKEKHPGAYETLNELFPKMTTDKWSGIFSKLDNASTIIGYINTGADVVSCFFDAYQKYLIAQALIDTQEDVLRALMVAGYYLPPIAQDYFVDALNSYLEVLDYDSAISAVSNYMLGGSIKNVYNIFKGSLQTIIYNGIANLLGVAAGNVNAVVFAYNTTYTLLDYFSGLGDMSELFFLLDSAAMLEDSIINVVDTTSSNLKSNATLKNAKMFDSSWGLLQAVEQYTYSGLSKYISAIKRNYNFEFAIKTTVGGYFTKYFALKELNNKNSNADNAIQVAVMFEGEWKNASCHDKNNAVSKLVSVKCPTDVYVYDESGNLVLSIINNKIEICDIRIAAIVDGDEKIFALSDYCKYNIKIVGTDNGTMDYSVCDILDDELITYTEFENVELTKDCVYTGTLDVTVSEDRDYSLSLDYCNHLDNNNNGICDVCETDLTLSCTHLCHSTNGFMQFIWKIARFIYRIFGMNQYCECGMAHW